MQETLFRGKPVNKADYTLYEGIYKADVFSNGFVYGSLIVKGKKHYICIGVAGTKLNCLINNATVTLVEVIPETVGRYTGVTDDNGKKIFEGDILGITNCDPDYSYITKVYLECNTLCVNVEGQDYDYTSIGFANDIWDDECDDVEIIGNIHDNPELLEA